MIVDYNYTDTFGCSEEALTVAAMLQVQHVFTQPSRAKAAAVNNLRLFTNASETAIHVHVTSADRVPIGYVVYT